VRSLRFTLAARAQFRLLLTRSDRAKALERLLRVAEDPGLSGALALVGSGTNLRRAKICGVHFFLLATPSSEHLPDPHLWVLKVKR
jgi:hypothetical protein